jgi:uncharacterized protein (DUF58 family)
MIRPTKRSSYIIAPGLALAMLPVVFGHALWIPWLVYALVTVALVGADAIILRTHPLPVVSLDGPSHLYMGGRAELTITIRRSAVWAQSRIDVLCDFGELLQAQPLESILSDSSPELRMKVPLKPLRRGIAVLERVWLRWTGPLGLATRQMDRSFNLEIPVLPDFHSVRAMALRFFGNRESLSGLKIERYTGEGSEFERMQEFVPGLDHRSIDWKASARHRKLLCREFRAERNHNIVIALDTGYLMGEPLDGIPRLDHAINAGLLLAYVSLRAGDRVGLFAFDQKVRTYLEPHGGPGIFPRLQVATSALEYSGVETNFTLALAELTQRLRRRALVVVLTDFVDTVTAELMVESLERIARNHLVLFVSLRDRRLEVVADREPARLLSVAESVVASGFIQEREVVLRRLVRAGIQVIDALPDKVSSHLINRYLEIKRREMIA